MRFLPFMLIVPQLVFSMTCEERFELKEPDYINEESKSVVIHDHEDGFDYFYDIESPKKGNYDSVIDFMIWNVPTTMKHKYSWPNSPPY